MNLAQIEDGFFVSGQLMPGQISELAAHGVKTIINNRPDDERGFYTPNNAMAEMAAQQGIDFHFIPIRHTGLTMEQVTSFASALDGADGPVVAYCASGRRCAMMWALAKAASKPADDILRACAAQGYDLSQMRPLLMQLAQAA